MNELRKRWIALRTSLWLVPTLIVLACAALAIGLTRLDDYTDLRDTRLGFGGDASAARSVLSTIAGSLITIAGLTFSITIVVLQLASSQFSPRVLRNFLADRVTQATAGAFVGIFLYALIVLRAVRDEGVAGGFVPAASVTVAIALATAALILLLWFIHHISQLIQVSGVTARIAQDTLGRIDELYPDPYRGEVEPGAEAVEAWEHEGDGVGVFADRPGYVQSVHPEGLAERLDGGRLAIDVAPGDFVSGEEPVARVWGVELDGSLGDDVRRAITIADDRDPTQDAAFGLRQLSDVALRALSPSVNDPTTAVMAIGYLRAILCRLAEREFPQEVEQTERGLTLVQRRRSFAEHLELLRELAPHGEDDPRVTKALAESLAAVSRCADRAGARERVEAAERIAAAVGS